MSGLGSTAVNRDTTAIDYLNYLRQYAASQQAANSAGTNLIPDYTLQLSDIIDITDAVAIGSVNSLSDTGDITDAVSEVDYPAGASSLAGNSFKKLWLQFNNDVADNSTNGNDGTTTYHSSLKALYAYNAQGNIKDATSGAHDLTLGGGTTVFKRGKEGVGLAFDGSTYYTASSAVIVSGTADRTVACWVKTPTAFVSGQTLWCWGAQSTHNFFGLAIVSSGSSWYFDCPEWAVSDNLSVTALQPNTWYHVVITLASTGSVTKMYVNGALEMTKTGMGQNTSSSSLYVGVRLDLNGTTYLGSGSIINQLRIYSTAVSAAQAAALYMVGVIGSCHTFDGGEYVTVGGASTFKFLSDGSLFSFGLWLKVPVGALSGTPVVFDNSGGGGFGNVGFTFFIRSNGEIDFQITNGGGVGPPLAVITSTGIYPDDGAWHHLVVTYDGTNGKIYLDSVLKQTTVKSGTYTFSSSNPAYTLKVGVRGDAAANFVTGQIDDVQVWTGYALSQAEINYLYAKKDGWQIEEDSDYQNLWLSFDNDYVDKSGNNNIGTLTGTETYVSGIAYADGRYSKAFSFNGSSYINYGNICAFERTQAFSYAFWIKSTHVGVQEMVITKNVSGGGGTGQQLQIQANEIPRMRLAGATTALIVEWQNVTFLRNGSWNYVVLTYDGSSTPAGMNMYVNGILQTSTTITNTLTETTVTADPLVIGARQDGFYTTALLDDVQIWNIVLSQAEINLLTGGQQIMHNPVVPTPMQSDFCEVLA